MTYTEVYLNDHLRNRHRITENRGFWGKAELPSSLAWIRLPQPVAPGASGGQEDTPPFGEERESHPRSTGERASRNRFKGAPN